MSYPPHSLGAVAGSAQNFSADFPTWRSPAGFDRDALRRREEGLIAHLLTQADTRVVSLDGDNIAVAGGDATAPDEDAARLELTPARGSADDPVLRVYLGKDAHTHYLAELHPAGEAPYGLSQPLRQVAGMLSPLETTLAMTAVALAHWHRGHGFCERCGSPTEPIEAGWVRRCTNDGSAHYPRTDPAVIMSVIGEDDRLLLARNAAFHGRRSMSVLAGFVEPGESLESAVAREVAEEVGLAVDDVRYQGGQPWPFPASLMLAFECRAHATDVHLDPEEIESARWFTREQLLAALESGEIGLPPRLSVARRLIEHWFGGLLPDGAAFVR